jgi:hypothetical protein
MFRAAQYVLYSDLARGKIYHGLALERFGHGVECHNKTAKTLVLMYN